MAHHCGGKETACRCRRHTLEIPCHNPAEIIICEKSGNRIKKYDLTDSVWARIGLVPTKVDLEKSNRDFQKTIHAAAKAIRNAMNFAPNLASLEKPAEKTTKTGKAEKVAEQPAGTVADESKKAA
mgnify:FL=1